MAENKKKNPSRLELAPKTDRIIHEPLTNYCSNELVDVQEDSKQCDNALNDASNKFDNFSN